MIYPWPGPWIPRPISMHDWKGPRVNLPKAGNGYGTWGPKMLSNLAKITKDSQRTIPFMLVVKNSSKVDGSYVYIYMYIT